MDKFKRALKFGFVGNSKYLIIITAIGFILGEIGLFIIMAVSDMDDFLSLGTFIARVILCFATLFITISTFTIDFKELVKLGVKRKTAITAMSVQTLGVSLIIECVLMLLDVVTRVLMKLVFGVGEQYFLMGSDVHWIGFAIVAAVFFLGLIAAVCINKFGPYGMIAIYFVYLVVFMVIPGLLERLQNYEKIQNIINYVLSSPLIITGVAVVVLVPVTILLFRSVYKTQIQ